MSLVASALVLAGCGASGEPDATASPATYAVPDVPVSVTAPAGWERLTQDGAFAVRSPDGFGDPAFQADVVVTGEAAGGPLDDAGAATAERVAAIDGWVPDAEGQGATTLGETPAYRVSGTVDVGGTPVAQEVLLVGSTAADGEPWTVYLTASHAVEDATGAEQARSVLTSVQVTPAG
ncbi:hypothetical protein [Cellulosimicrobium sp. Marseille-Q4280]|jgi:hypothetical protein|uniref:hypothetical protein n=1 Tax=Cellulosimicrobium sp. Marseille-Q4280 TaxID=2937992 RepID=UPI00203D8099|nr:hypothetical protein [Cellulosimicrobium sp. Marseille-Q4280]